MSISIGAVALSFGCWRAAGNDSFEIDGKEGWGGTSGGESRGLLATGGDGPTVSPSCFDDGRNVYCCGGSRILAIEPGDAPGLLAGLGGVDALALTAIGLGAIGRGSIVEDRMGS